MLDDMVFSLFNEIQTLCFVIFIDFLSFYFYFAVVGNELNTSYFRQVLCHSSIYWLFNFLKYFFIQCFDHVASQLLPDPPPP